MIFPFNRLSLRVVGSRGIAFKCRRKRLLKDELLHHFVAAAGVSPQCTRPNIDASIRAG